MAEPGHVRCAWVAGAAENMLAYHDEEWGVPLHDDRALFELLTLEGAQAGLSWTTILNRREGYRQAFAAGRRGLMHGRHMTQASFGQRHLQLPGAGRLSHGQQNVAAADRARGQ